MSTKEQYLEVETVIFESHDTDAMLKGKIVQGNLSYSSELVISHTQVNHVLNQLQKLNPENVVLDLLEATPMYDNTTLFSASFNDLENQKIDLTLLSNYSEIIEIRA